MANFVLSKSHQQPLNEEKMKKKTGDAKKIELKSLCSHGIQSGYTRIYTNFECHHFSLLLLFLVYFLRFFLLYL
jgi:hypothetical protein